MKKSFIFGLFAAALALVSCNSTDGVDTSRQDGMSLNFFAMPPVEANSRAALTEDSEGLNFAYSVGDTVTVTNSENKSYKFTLGADSKFTCKDAKATENDVKWEAYFPSKEVDLKEQDGTLAGLANKYIMYGEKTTTGAKGLEITLEVKCAVLKIKNDKGSIDINVKTSESNYVTGISADGKAKTSETSTSILKVDKTGTYYVVVPAGVQLAIKDGNKVIKSTTTAGLTAGCYYNLEIESVINVTSVTLDKTTAEVEVGKTVTLTPTVAPENATNKSVTWSSSNEAVATVSPEGVVTGVAAGTATITATAKDGSGVNATCTVTVNSAVQQYSVKFEKTDFTGFDTSTLTASNDDVTIVLALSSDNGNPEWNSMGNISMALGDSKLTITVTPKAGVTVTGIEYKGQNNTATKTGAGPWEFTVKGDKASDGSTDLGRYFESITVNYTK